MQAILSNKQLADRFRTLARNEGEAVWNRQIVDGKRRLSLPFMGTTWLANNLEKGSMHPLDPNAWVVESSGEHEWRLYLRVGEAYGEGWGHQLMPPVDVAINSRSQFTVISQIPRDHWWQAEFVCPFCDRLCWEKDACPHLMTIHHSIKEPYRKPGLVKLMAEMREREFNCNILNADIDGLKIKVPRNFTNAEWFRFAYWYIRSPEMVERIEQVLLEGRRATRYEGTQ